MTTLKKTCPALIIQYPVKGVSDFGVMLKLNAEISLEYITERFEKL